MEKFLKVLKNYYIVFSVCALCVLVTALLFGMKFYKEHQARKTALLPPPTVVELAPSVSKPETEIKKETVTDEIKKESVKEPVIETMAAPKIEEFKLAWPVEGELMKGYSADDLVYSDTFDDYRVHNGIDIKSKRSEAVLCAADGVVENIYTDVLEGIIIEINHNNGYKSIYKNLSTDKMIKKGESVVKGQAISGVGETAIFESADEEHLHFELLKDDAYTDPLEYME